MQTPDEACPFPPPAARISGSDSVVNLIPALIAARKEMGTIVKNKTADVPTKSGGKYQYTYADLATVIESTSGPLLDNGLCLLQTTRWDGRDLWLNSTLMHASGEWLACDYPIFCDYSIPQSIGGAISYARRYSMQSMLNLATEDDDAQSASGRDRGQARNQQSMGDDRRQQRRDDRPRQQQTSREEVNRQFPVAAGGKPRETWSQWIGPVVTKANQEWRAAMASEGVDPRFQKEYSDLTMEPREVNFLCTKMLEAETLNLTDIAKEGSVDVRDPAKCRRVVMAAFSRHPDRIKQAIEEHVRTKEDELRAKLGMAELDDESDQNPPGVGGYEGTEVASETPPPLTQTKATQKVNSN